jgi:L-alanine-DL-glutamate epimerase-like enolase superfamily enzyme
VYLDGYADQLDSIDRNGCVQVPEGPGLGVALDWDFIESQKVARAVWT